MSQCYNFITNIAIMQKHSYNSSRRALLSLLQSPVGCLAWVGMPPPPLDLLIPVYQALSAVVLETQVPFFCKWKASQQSLLYLVPETSVERLNPRKPWIQCYVVQFKSRQQQNKQGLPHQWVPASVFFLIFMVHEVSGTNYARNFSLCWT